MAPPRYTTLPTYYQNPNQHQQQQILREVSQPSTKPPQRMALHAQDKIQLVEITQNRREGDTRVHSLKIEGELIKQFYFLLMELR